MSRFRAMRRRPLSIITVALFAAVVVLLILVWFAVYRPAAVAASLATFVVVLVWLSDRRDRTRQDRARRDRARRAGKISGPPQP